MPRQTTRTSRTRAARKPPAVVGYCRVSTVGQADEGVSLDAQRERITAWAAAGGREVVGVFTDAGLSGGRADNRPELQRALAAACDAGGVLAVYSLSRLARSTADTIAIGDRLAAAGADLVSLTESIDTTGAAGRMVFKLLAVLAEFERDLIGERTAAAMGHLRRQGRRISRHLPYGFDLADDGRTLVANADERRVLDSLRRRRRAGASLRQLADRLNRDAVPPKAGAAWYASSVRAVLLADDRRRDARA